MTQANQDMKFEVSLYPCDDGDCLKIEIAGAQSMVLFLSPHQARAFASELIQTVYRAEVKNSLQKKQQSASGSTPSGEQGANRYGVHPHAA
jgi:hypothetical protein